MYPGFPLLLTNPNSLRSFLCHGWFHPTALSMSEDGKKGSKFIAAESSWDFLQKNLWSWRKCHWEALLPTATCGKTFQKWGSEGTCLQEPGWVCISFTPCNWRTEAIFACVLVLAGTELTLFLVAGTVLCFGFSVRILLITLWCFSCY